MIETLIKLGLILIPWSIRIIATIVLGTYMAGVLGFTGIVWWAFVIVFYLIISGVLTALYRLGGE